MKRVLLIFGLWVLLNATAFGQDAVCPIKITDVRHVRDHLTVLFRNTSKIDITEYAFIVWFVDHEGQMHFVPDPDPGLTGRVVKPGKSAFLYFPAPETLEFTFSVANAYLLHVTFADGAVWNDDGSHACSMAALQE